MVALSRLLSCPFDDTCLDRSLLLWRRGEEQPDLSSKVQMDPADKEQEAELKDSEMVIIDALCIFPSPKKERERYWNKCLSATVATAVNKFSWAADFIVVHLGVIGILEPLEAPAASFLELTRQLAALGFAVNSTVTISPAVSRSSPLTRAAVEESHSSAWNEDVELTATQITSGVAHLLK